MAALKGGGGSKILSRSNSDMLELWMIKELEFNPGAYSTVHTVYEHCHIRYLLEVGTYTRASLPSLFHASSSAPLSSHARPATGVLARQTPLPSPPSSRSPDDKVT